MSLYSTFADVSDEDRHIFDNPTNHINVEFRRFVREVCVQFNLQISRFIRSASQPSAQFVTPGGLHAGTASVTHEGTKDGKELYRYRFASPSISKEKSSANSDRGTRDSSNLATLIRTIKKNKEVPTYEAIAKEMFGGVNFVLTSIRNNSIADRPRLSINNDIIHAMTRKILGIDEAFEARYISELKDAHSKFQSDMSKYNDTISDVARYAKGMDLVLIDYKMPNKPAYFVTSATVDIQKDVWDFQGELKRYDSLKDSPLATEALMIRAHMEAHADFDNKNELGLAVRDKYYPDIDISIGYGRHDRLWVAIPKFAE